MTIRACELMFCVCFISGYTFGRPRNRDTGQPESGWFLVPFELQPARRLSTAKHYHSCHRHRWCHKVQGRFARDEIRVLAVLQQQHSSWLANMDRVDHNTYVIVHDVQSRTRRRSFFIAHSSDHFNLTFAQRFKRYAWLVFVSLLFLQLSKLCYSSSF